MGMRNIIFHGVAMNYLDGKLIGVGPGDKQPVADMAWHLLSEEDRVLVGGGGLGYIASRLAAVASYVLVYEANPLLAELMAAGVSVAGGQFTVIAAALSTRDGEVALGMTDLSDWQQARVVDLEGISPQDRQTPHILRTRGDDISRVIQSQCCNVLALDVEGAEHALLHGMIDEAWDRVDKIILELHTHVLADGGKSVMDLLYDRGFIQLRSDAYLTTFSPSDKRPTAEIRGLYLAYIHRRRLLPATAALR